MSAAARFLKPLRAEISGCTQRLVPKNICPLCEKVCEMAECAKKSVRNVRVCEKAVCEVEVCESVVCEVESVRNVRVCEKKSVRNDGLPQLHGVPKRIRSGVFFLKNTNNGKVKFFINKKFQNLSFLLPFLKIN